MKNGNGSPLGRSHAIATFHSRWLPASSTELGLDGDVRVRVRKDGTSHAIRVNKSCGGGRPPSVPKSPVLDKPQEIAQRTIPSTFQAFLKTIRARGVETKTHVKNDFGTIDISTPDTLFIVAGSMTPTVFAAAFVTLLFQRQHADPSKPGGHRRDDHR